jgi:glycosyltransferase involved in cell wall biosynthesis
MRVAFLPVWRGNPYHAELKAALCSLGIDVLCPESLKSFYRDCSSGAEKVDVVHLHALPRFSWSPTTLRRNVMFYLRLSRLQERGARLIWTVHDLQNHESGHRLIEDLIGRSFSRRLDAMIVHGNSAKQILESRWGVRTCRRIHVMPHGHYIHSYSNNISREAARKRFGLDASNLVFLFFGQIRPYKGVAQMVEAFRACAEQNARLIIAGRPLNEAITNEIARSIQGDFRIRFLPGHVPDDEVQLYMNASDVVVLPYKRIFTSGAAILAMSFGKPCVAPHAGCVADTLDEEGAVFFDPQIHGDLERALRQTVACRRRLSQMGLHNVQRAAGWDWKGIARATVAVYEGRKTVHEDQPQTISM